VAAPLVGLPQRPSQLGTELPTGQWVGMLDFDVLALGRRHGRARRWSYLAAADEQVAAGAAVVDLGYTVASFVWVCRDGQVTTWERKGLPRRHGRVPGTASHGPAWFRAGRDEVVVDPHGRLQVAVSTRDGAITAEVDVATDSSAVIVVPTAGGGWNATQKVAGEVATGRVGVGGWQHELRDAGSWRDYTVGRQDRQTAWRWAAGAGHAGQQRVGLNLSTGMNEHPPGENLVWWDGIPYSLPLEVLRPLGGFEGPWMASGPGWSLDFQPVGVRAADENLLVVRSRYVQPIGTFTGTLPKPDGSVVDVHLQGVTEDHAARW
jgi:hypothetical protein